MKKRFLLIILLVIGMYYSPGILAQEALVSAGGKATGSNGTVVFAIGEVFYASATGANASLKMGVIQNTSMSLTTDLNSRETQEVEILAYPNPVVNELIVKVTGAEYGNLNFELYDSRGKLLEQHPIYNEEFRIDVSQYTKGIYILKINNETTHIKTVKIIKK